MAKFNKEGYFIRAVLLASERKSVEGKSHKRAVDWLFVHTSIERGGFFSIENKTLLGSGAGPKAGDEIRTRDFHLGKVTLYH